MMTTKAIQKLFQVANQLYHVSASQPHSEPVMRAEVYTKVRITLVKPTFEDVV